MKIQTKRRLEDAAYYLLLFAVVALVHVGLYFLCAYLFNHGSSTAFEIGAGLVVIDVIFWCFVASVAIEIYKKIKRFRVPKGHAK